MKIERTRSYQWKTPTLPAVREWLTRYYNKELESVQSAKQLNQLKLTFEKIPDSYIWSEYTKPLGDSQLTYLGCFSVIRRGFAVTDAVLSYTTLQQLIQYYTLPVKTVDTYYDLFLAIKADPARCLYYVKRGSGKYGVIVDEEKVHRDCAEDIQTSIGGICFDIRVNFMDNILTVDEPHVGEVTLSWPGFETVTLEALPLNEIKKLSLS